MFLIIGIIILALLFVVVFPFYYIQYSQSKYGLSDYYIPIELKQFISLYNIAQNKWQLRCDNVVYCKTEYECDKQWFYFKTFLDYLKYHQWLRHESKRKIINKQTSKQLEIRKQFLKDIQNYKKSIEEVTNGKSFSQR